MAVGLAGAGYNVIATAAKERAEIDSLAAEAKDLYGDARILPVLADVTSEDDCDRVIDTAVRHFGSIDILVNNAGRGMKYVSEDFLTEPTRFWEVSPSLWKMVIGTNVTGPFLMARAAVPLMLKAGWGRIVNISMNSETMRRRGFSPYGPSKAALESETIIWAQDLAGTGVTVNALLPGGATLTGMIPDSVSAEIRSKLLDPRIVVPPLLWLVSPDADEVTGRRIVATQWSEAEPLAEQAGWNS
ncbi:Oxidoreductase, short-chain dehydrogenase/reductase family [Azospirillum endophyticum]